MAGRVELIALHNAGIDEDVTALLDLVRRIALIEGS